MKCWVYQKAGHKINLKDRSSVQDIPGSFILGEKNHKLMELLRLEKPSGITQHCPGHPCPMSLSANLKSLQGWALHPCARAGKPSPLRNSPQYPTLNGTFTCLHPLQPTGRAFRTPHSQQLPEMAEADEELGGEAGSAQLGWNKAQLGSPGSRAVTSKMWTHI